MKGATRRRTLRVGVLVTALVAIATGVAYATIPDGSGVYTACKLNATGTIRLIDPSLGSASLLGHCTSLETQITWNQRGQSGAAGPVGPAGKDGTNGHDGTNGRDGVSVTSAALPSGDTNCPGGGSQFTSISGTSYACSGAKGDAGAAGNDGTNGSNGTNGVSVTSAAEPAGANCAAGGSAFTSANGTTYACNGAKGDAGATGSAGSGGETFTSLAIAMNGTPVTVMDVPTIGKVEARCTNGLGTTFPGLFYTNTSSVTHSVGLLGGGGITSSTVPPGGTHVVPAGRTPIGWDVTTSPGANEPVAVIESFDRVLPSNACVFIVGVELGN